MEVMHIGEEFVEQPEEAEPQDPKMMARMLKILLEDFDMMTKLLILRALFGIEPEDLLGRR